MWFYNKKIDIYEYKPYVDEHHVKREKYEKMQTIDTDIQPYSKDKVQKEYGYDIECTNRMFCDIDEDIKENMVVLYNGDTYRVKKIIKWDDYFDIILNAESVKI